jgi:hypothetical protein
MRFGWVRADNHDDVGIHDADEWLRTGGRAERLLQSIAGR